MRRELCIAELEVPGKKSLVVATSHLESPCPAPPKWDRMFSKERVDQAKEAINLLKKNSNVIFCGDMNWLDCRMVNDIYFQTTQLIKSFI
jgi:tyrosyl-DNA phosphodiesterase 2